MASGEPSDQPERVEPQHVVRRADGHRADLEQSGSEAGEEALQCVPPAGQQGVEMSPLWHPGARCRMVGQAVALDDRNSPEVPAQRLRSGESADARSEHDGMVVTGFLGHRHGRHDAQMTGRGTSAG